MSPRPTSSLSRIVSTVARPVSRLMLLYAFYIVFHGQITHGDGFAAGVIMALAMVLLLVAFGKDVVYAILTQGACRIMASFGGLLLVGIAVGGLMEKGYFFFNFLGKGQPYEFWSGGIVPFCNLAIDLLVTGSLFGIVMALVLFKPNPKGGSK